jgi:nucleosome binding factor SPN SPT16 subunit
MADIKIDTKTFQERLSHFISAWKADKRSGDALFGGANSIVILMGKVEEEQEFHKNNAMHVRLSLLPSFPLTWSRLARRAQPFALFRKLTVGSFGFSATSFPQP